MVRELSHKTISLVVDTWEMANQVPEFGGKAGLLIFTKLFELAPQTKAVFGIEEMDANVFDCPNQRLRFLNHSKRVISNLDTVLSCLGPGDTEKVTKDLQQLGRQHIQYGVKVEYLPFLGTALIQTLREFLGDAIWQNDVNEAWATVYNEITMDFTKGMLSSEIIDETATPLLQSADHSKHHCGEVLLLKL